MADESIHAHRYPFVAYLADGRRVAVPLWQIRRFVDGGAAAGPNPTTELHLRGREVLLLQGDLATHEDTYRKVLGGGGS